MYCIVCDPWQGVAELLNRLGINEFFVVEGLASASKIYFKTEDELLVDIVSLSPSVFHVFYESLTGK